MNNDKITVEVLEDGTIKMTTDQVSGPNHSNAEGFMRSIAQMTDGKMTREKRKPDHKHSHGQHQSHSH
jgi:hypothetical protein